MATFLSDDWFTKVAELTAAAGDLNLPPALQDLAINLNVTDSSEGDVAMALANGKLVKGNDDSAETALSLDADTLKKVILEFDMSAAMEAFMSGKIRVDGDMSKLMALQTAQPSAEQKTLFKKVLEMTEI